MTRKTRLKIEDFADTLYLEIYVNTHGIEQKDIQSIVYDSKERIYYLFYWEEVLDYDR